MTVVVALVFLVVAALVAGAFHFMARGHRALSAHALDGEVSFQFGAACVSAAIRHYFDRMNDVGDPLYKAVAEGAVSVALTEFRPSTHAGLASIMKDFPGLDARVTGRLSDLAKLGEAAGAADASEKKAHRDLLRRHSCARPARRSTSRSGSAM
jgi:hypothetical protein